jgi:glutathione S-transferase
MITLYDCATAPSPRRARILLAEKGIAHATVQVDLRSGEQFGEAYRRINPLCTVPALVVDSGDSAPLGVDSGDGAPLGVDSGDGAPLVLSDNAAITAWAEAQFPEPPLLGRTPAEKAEVASWMWRVEFEGLLAVAEALRNSSPAMAGRALPGPVGYAQIPALAERGLARLQQFFAVLNERLAEREFIATDRFSVVDITAVVAVDFARVVKVRPGDTHPHLQRWRAAMAGRASMAP